MINSPHKLERRWLQLAAPYSLKANPTRGNVGVAPVDTSDLNELAVVLVSEHNLTYYLVPTHIGLQYVRDANAAISLLKILHNRNHCPRYT